MNITLIPKQPEPVRTEKLIVNGEEIGKVDYKAPGEAGSQCHVVIDASRAEGGGLYQCHGATLESAIREAIERHRLYASAQIRRLDELETAIFGNA
jgi:hypothetical protein